MSDHEDIVNAKVNIAILNEQVKGITELCTKMDQIIEKLVDQHDKHITKVYDDIEKRRLETDMDIKEIHDRIDMVLDRVQATENKLLNEIKFLRQEMASHNKRENESFQKLLQWKWMLVGGIIVISWLISHTNFDMILNAFVAR